MFCYTGPGCLPVLPLTISQDWTCLTVIMVPAYLTETKTTVVCSFIAQAPVAGAMGWYLHNLL
jgi:hypothetical protein